MVGAVIVNVDNDRNIWIDAETLDSQTIYVGDEDVTFNIDVENNIGPMPDATDDSWIENAELEISTTVYDEDGNSVLTPIKEWDIRVSTGQDGRIQDNGANEDYDGFRFDVKEDAVPGRYSFEVRLTYENETFDGPFYYTATILFDIDARGDVGDLPYNDILTPGDQNKDVRVQVYLHEYVTDIYLRITRPDTDFTWFGTTSTTSSSYVDGESGWWYPTYIISVSSIKDAGTYTGTYVLEYTINEGEDDEVRCTETGDIDFLVGHLAMLSASSTTTTIAQGTSMVTMSLTFTNTGTVDLYSIMVWLDIYNDAFSFMPLDHWEDNEAIGFSEAELGDVAVGDSATISMDVGINLYIPEGNHKIMFAFDGYYYDPDSQTYKELETWWTQAASLTPAEYKVMMDGTTFTIDPDTSSVEATYIMVAVTDTAIDIRITSGASLSLARQLVDNRLDLEVENYGNIDYDNVIFRIETNSATSPFLNVVDPEALFSEEAIVGTLDAGNWAYPTMRVTLVAGTDAGVHLVPITMTAVNSDMGESITVTLNARVTISGVGPKLEITAVSPESIKKGADFTLTLTITNNGDDTARNVMLTMPYAGASGLAGLYLTEEPNDINGDLTAPTADALPIFIEDIAPGQSVEVEVEMKSNKDMSSGHVYVIYFSTSYADSFSDGHDVSHIVSLKSSGLGGSTVGMFYYALIILILVAALFLITYTVIYAKKYKKENPKGGKVETETTTYTPPPEPPTPVQEAPIQETPIQETYEEPPPAPPME